MGDNNKALWKMVKSITNWETRQKLSSKPFEPCGFDLLFSEVAPQFYCENEMLQIKNFRELHSRLGFGTMKKTENNNQRVVTREKRARPIKEVLNDEEKAQASKPLKKKSKKTKIASKDVQELPIELMNRIAELHGCDINFLMSKKLYKSDLDRDKNRLSMPGNSINCEFLTEAEKKCTGELRMEVAVLDPCLREFSLTLRKWTMTKAFTYNLIKNWYQVAFENKFKEDDELQIWSFRVNSKLYFVLNKV